MNVEWWELIYWAVSILGVTGTIALFVFFPAAAGIALKAIVRFFSIVLSYRIGCAVVAAIVAALIADYARHSIEDNRHAAEVAAFEQAQDERDKRIAKETRDKVLVEIANATAENAVTDKDVKEFSDALPPAPATGNPFRIGDDADRLCRIAGETQCGPIRGQGVPSPRPKGRGAKSGHQ